MSPSISSNFLFISLFCNQDTLYFFRINPLSLIEILAFVVRQFKNKKDAISFLEKFEPRVKANGEALALCKVLFFYEHLINYK